MEDAKVMPKTAKLNLLYDGLLKRTMISKEDVKMVGRGLILLTKNNIECTRIYGIFK
jgi:hypothetical protein